MFNRVFRLRIAAIFQQLTDDGIRFFAPFINRGHVASSASWLQPRQLLVRQVQFVIVVDTNTALQNRLGNGLGIGQ